ncbi:MAG: hypothetical protein OHK0052_27490 [Anaerolineales bacterium]
MKSFHYSIWLMFFVMLPLAACVAAAPVQPSAPAPLPTADVPDLAAVDRAIDLWQHSGNTRYFVTIEESQAGKLQRIQIVVTEDGPRAALRTLSENNQWGEPQAMPLEAAQAYTVDGLLERLRRDTLGEGVAPVNLRVIFDSSAGFPQVAFAEAIPGYDENGQVRLNRAAGYSLSVTVQPLLEDVSEPGKTPILRLSRSNGAQAWCDNLLIFEDNTSLYTDDCRQTVLPSQPSQVRWQELTELRAQFASLQTETRADGAVQTLWIAGTGSAAATPQQIESAWRMAQSLHQLLSYPLGAGVTLMFAQSDELFGLEMLSQTTQAARLGIQGSFHGAVVSPDGRYLAYSDGRGLPILDLESGQRAILLAPPEDGGFYQPADWKPTGELLVRRFSNTGEPYGAPGWVSFAEPYWHDLPITGCDSGMAWSPDGSVLIVAGASLAGLDCGQTPGLWRFTWGENALTPLAGRTLATGELAGAASPAWSPDSAWIAFSLQETASLQGESFYRLYVIHPDGSGLAPVSTNTRGVAGQPVWSPDGVLYYQLSAAAPEDNGIYRYDLSTAQTTRLLAGELSLISLSPDGNFLLYREADTLKIWVFLREENLPITLAPQDGIAPQFVDWLSPPAEAAVP